MTVALTNESIVSCFRWERFQPFSATIILRMTKTIAEQVVPAMDATMINALGASGILGVSPLRSSAGRGTTRTRLMRKQAPISTTRTARRRNAAEVLNTNLSIYSDSGNALAASTARSSKAPGEPPLLVTMISNA